jgi:DNA-binding IclR family transcriptional regulator
LRADKLQRLLDSLPLDRRTSQTLTDIESLMQELGSIRARGYSTDNEEFMDGMCAVAVPIKDTEGRLLTTLSIHAPDQRRSLDNLVDMLAPLHRAAEKLASLN